MCTVDRDKSRLEYVVGQAARRSRVAHPGAPGQIHGAHGQPGQVLVRPSVPRLAVVMLSPLC